MHYNNIEWNGLELSFGNRLFANTNFNKLITVSGVSNNNMIPKPYRDKIIDEFWDESQWSLS